MLQFDFDWLIDVWWLMMINKQKSFWWKPSFINFSFCPAFLLFCSCAQIPLSCPQHSLVSSSLLLANSFWFFFCNIYPLSNKQWWSEDHNIWFDLNSFARCHSVVRSFMLITIVSNVELKSRMNWEAVHMVRFATALSFSPSFVPVGSCNNWMGWRVLFQNRIGGNNSHWICWNLLVLQRQKGSVDRTGYFGSRSVTEGEEGQDRTGQDETDNRLVWSEMAGSSVLYPLPHHFAP